MSLHSDQQIASPRLNPERYNGNGTLSRHPTGYGTISGAAVAANLSDSDSWLGSSRSRETSPSSSIPPSLPAFRVIPLCESESSGTHLSEPAILPPPLFSRNSRDFPVKAPEVGVKAADAGQPLLRRNQYWVWHRPAADPSLVSVSDPDSGFGRDSSQSDSGSGCSHHKRVRSAVRSQLSADTLSLGHRPPLKGILKNNQCSTLPRQHCSCSYLGETLPEPDDSVYYSSANISCEPGDKLSDDEVLDTVESCV